MSDVDTAQRNETDPDTIHPDESVLYAPHAAEPDRVLRALQVSEDGLTSDDAQRRLDQYGPNKLPEAKQSHVIVRFIKHFNDVLIYILLVAAVLKAIYQDWIDFWVILAVAVGTAAIGFIQEGQAERALAGIRNLLSLEARAKRDGEWSDVASDELVPGDVVRISPGDKVPADVRLLSASQLQIDESALTGESVPAMKDLETASADAVVGDRHGMAFSGTVVATGNATAVVTGTGSHTEIGRIQSMISDVEDLGTPLTRQLARIGTRIAGAILGIAAAMMLYGRLVHDDDPQELIDAAITFAVAAVPEGLPAIVTITLALGVQQMAKRRAITRKLTAVETLGQVTTICSDKTGTLTLNEMTVRSVVTPSNRYAVDGVGYEPDGRVTVDGTDEVARAAEHPELTELVSAMVLCNDAGVHEEDGTWSVVGTPTEGSLIVLGHKFDADFGEHERLAELPFDSANKFMAVLDRDPDGEVRLLVKGAPDRLLERSTRQAGADGSTDEIDIDEWEARIDELASQGLRVLAAAYAPGDAAPDPEIGNGESQIDVDDVADLIFLGIVGIVDPPREEAIRAIADSKRAGIRITMITGDHAATAASISKELGIPEGDEPRVVTGAELQEMKDTELIDIAPDVDVFARTSPEHKLRIVRALQKKGQVVAMTGDGVNDAPALTRADTGIAMGIAGTEATKDAADIVLADDNFATIEAAVSEGRRIYDNIQKSLIFILPTTFGQALIVLTAVLFGFTPPLQPTQVLWVNLVTALTLSLALAYEPAEPGVMSRPPRSAKDSIITGPMLHRIIWVTLLIAAATIGVFFFLQDRGASFAEAQTAAVLMLVLGQVVYLFNSRFVRNSSITPKVFVGNRVVWYSVGGLLLLQLGFTYLPFMQSWFHTVPLSLDEWGLTILLSIGIFFAAELQKWFARTFG